MKEFIYLKPETVKEASEYLITYGTKAQILNGGSDLLIRLKSGITTADALVDIKNIKELHKISYDENNGLFIGACVILNKLVENDNVVIRYPILIESIRSLGSVQIRNRATCIGNICNASPLADTATPLLVLNAIVHIYGPEEERDVSIHDFFKSVKKTCLREGEIVTGISIPQESKSFKGIFQKLSRRKEVDLSTVCASIGKINDEYRIGLGAVAPTPIRAIKAEKYLRGKELKDLDDNIINNAIDIVIDEISPISDLRASKEYREEMVKVLVERGLKVLSALN